MRSYQLCFLAMAFLIGCEQQTKKQDPASYGTPKSYYGEVVNKARNISGESDSRNSELDKQAKELGGE